MIDLFYSRNAQVFSILHVSVDIYISQNYYLFAHDSWNGLKFSVRKSFIYSTVKSLESILFCIWNSLDMCLLLDDQVFLNFELLVLILPVL